MDSRELLGEAVFQLTPTRTRCDLLVVAAGDGSRERISSGLVAPFLSHLRSARDQIPRGGYSFSLRPPAAPAPWFTAGTVRRLVRFVTTPEILERAVTIENEIVHIEDEIDRTNVSAASEAAGEHSKHDLQLVLENRKKMLQKEQGMAYARASIAGYEKNHIDDLVMFADAFGASRLREACISFKELCAEKEKDNLWVDELAALEASSHSQISSVQSSGIVLTSETENNTPLEWANTAPSGMGFTPWNPGKYMTTNGDASQSKHQIPMGWIPEYMYSFHGPMGPNSAPFQSYAYPGMQFLLPYSIHSANPQQRSHDEEFNNSSDHDVDSHVEHKHPELRGESDDDTFDKNHQQKIPSKNLSRKIVIHNINYISKGRPTGSDESEESSDNDDFVNEDFLRHEAGDIVGSFEKHKSSESNSHHSKSKRGKQSPDVLNGSSDVDKNTEDAATGKKTDDNWGAFQNILMKDESITQDMDQKGIGLGGDNKQQNMGIVDEYYTIKSNSLTTSSTYDYQQLEGKLEKSTIPKVVESDPIVVDGRHTRSGDAVSGKSMKCDDRIFQSIKRVQNDNEEFLLSQRNTAVISAPKDFSNFIDEIPEINNQKDGDLSFVESESKFHREAGNGFSFESELIQKTRDQNCNESRVEDVVFDYSVTPERSSACESTFSSLETDMRVISGIVVDDLSKNSNQPTEYVVLDSHEPDDLQILFGRDSIVKQVSTSSFPEVDFNADMAYISANAKNSPAEPDNSTSDEKPCNKNNTQRNNNAKLSPNGRKPKSLYGSLAKSRFEVLTRNRKLSNMSKEAIQRTKAQMEEENRKRLEELMIERQKRISQRSVNSLNITVAKQSKTNTKSVTKSLRTEKNPSQSKVKEARTMGIENSHISQQNKHDGFGHVTKVQHPTGMIRKI